uniref:LEM domain-containing protein n=1 Tax=Romanomermis culicivorax TaxID=13658 RepID=A0A915KYW8_ROMCU
MDNSDGDSSSLFAAIPLHFLAGSSSTYAFTAAQVLLSKGADPNYRNDEGLTPVHVAAAWGNYEILKLFLMNGGDPCLKDEDDKTPLDLANDERHSECARLLKWWTEASGDGQRSSKTTTPSSANKLNDDSKIALTTPRFFRSPLRRENCGCSMAKSKNSASRDRIKRKLFNQSQNESTIVANLSPSEDTTRKLTPELPLLNNLNTELENMEISSKHELSADGNTSKHCAISTKSLSPILNHDAEEESSDTSLDQFCTCLSRDLRRGLSPSIVSVSGDQVDGACLGKRILDASVDHRSSEDAILNQTALNLAKRLCNAELRSRLQALGDDVGPINERTRGLYERRLALHLSGELESSQNAISEAIQFRRFLQAVFYIGKGKKSRPLQHLIEACRLRECKNDIKLSNKVKKILSLWESDRGVVSLHVFQNTIPAEAYSREAAMIDAIGIKNLTNVKRGDYYGLTANWTIVKRRQFGSYLLKRAHEILKLERLNPLKCNDILNNG